MVNTSEYSTYPTPEMKVSIINKSQYTTNQSFHMSENKIRRQDATKEVTKINLLTCL